MLARRDHCSAELAARLEARGFDADVVQTTLAELVARGYLDDERYARAWIRAHAARGQGPLRLRQELLAHGLATAIIEGALEAYASEGGEWLRLAREVRLRRFGRAAPRERAELARQMRFLQYRGFSHEHIRQVLGEDAPDESD